MWQVGGMVVRGGGGGVQAQGQPRRHAEVLGRGVGAEPPQVLLWYTTRGHSMGQLPGQTSERRGREERERGKEVYRNNEGR